MSIGRSLGNHLSAHLQAFAGQVDLTNVHGVQIGRLVKNEPGIEMAIADEIQNLKEYRAGVVQTSELPVEDFVCSAGGGFLLGAVPVS